MMRGRRGAACAGVLAALALAGWMLWGGPASPAIVAVATAAAARKRAAPAELCIFFVSCNRTQLLGETVASVERHLRRYEPRLRAELVLVDQGSTAAARAELARKHSFSVRVAAG